MKLLDENGLIAEPTSDRYGQRPLDNPKHEKRLRIGRWLFLLIPIMGIIPFSIMSDELTDKYGYTPWWL
jgi:hypothetical protein